MTARMTASSSEVPTAHPHGFRCLMTAQAGSRNSPASASALSKSMRLLCDSSLPLSSFADASDPGRSGWSR